MTEDQTDSDPSAGSAISSVFVVGNSRSGTTLMARILGQHTDVLYFPETHFFGELWEPDDLCQPLSRERAGEIISILLSRVRDGYYTSGAENAYMDEAAEILEVTSGEPWDLFSRFQQHLTRLAGKRMACEQTPKNLYYLNHILCRYPDSRAICMIRDPRDVLLSQRQRWRRRWLGASHIPMFETARAWANYHPLTTSKIWNSAADYIDCFRSHPQCEIVRYEDLVEDAETVVQGVMKFLELDFEPQQLSVPQAGSSEMENEDGSFGIRPGRVGAWRNRREARADFQICQSICRTRMESFGYEAESIRYSKIAYVYKYASLPFQLSIALLLNIGRWNKLGVAIRQRIHSQRVAG